MKNPTRRRRAPWLAAIILLLVSAPAAPQRFVEIPAGTDCWDTACGDTRFSFCQVPIPAGFFGPGSEPFRGEVFLQGATGTPFDTQVERCCDMFFDEAIREQTIDIELVALDLVSCQPIRVEIQGEAVEWDVAVELSHHRPPPGVMTVQATHDNGGVFSSLLPVQPVFTFTRVDDPGQVLVIDSGEIGFPPELLVSLDEVPWVIALDPDVGADSCAPLFAPGVRQIERGRQKGEQCCEVVCHSGATPTHCIEIDRDCSGCPDGACCFGKKGKCKVFKANRKKSAEERCLKKKNSVYHGDGSSCADSDGDRLADVRERNNCCAAETPCGLRSSPIFADTDGDGVDDRQELANGTDVCDPGSS